MNECELCQMRVWRWSHGFLLLLNCISLHPHVKLTSRSWSKPRLILRIMLFPCCWVEHAKCSLRTSTSMLMILLVSSFPFCSVFLWFWYQHNSGPIERICNCFPLLFSKKELCRISVISSLNDWDNSSVKSFLCVHRNYSPPWQFSSAWRQLFCVFYLVLYLLVAVRLCGTSNFIMAKTDLSCKEFI